MTQNDNVKRYPVFHFGYLKPHTSEVFIKDVWKTDRKIGIIGFDGYTLCDGYIESNAEIYLAVSLNPNIKKYGKHTGHEYFDYTDGWHADKIYKKQLIRYDEPQYCFAESLKRDYLFYVQRDSYHQCVGVSDLYKPQFFPAGNAINIDIDTPIFTKIAAVNATDYAGHYDAFVTIFYVEYF